MTPQDELLFLPLGGSGEIGMNVNLYGARGKWIMVDLGMTFGDPRYPGIEIVLPDLAFIEERRRDLLGIVLTHGHEDHIGAIPYLAADLKVPLYATPFTAGLIARKLEEEGLLGEVTLNIVPMGGRVTLGDFTLSYVALAHSIPEGNALLIDTPWGRIFHTGDWKLDDAPLLGNPVTAAELQAIGDQGVLALVGDSTNVFNPEASGSESDVRDGLMRVVKARRTGRVLVTTFASNAARLATLGEVARASGRELVLAGRSMDRIVKVARATGYLADMPDPIDWDTAMALPRERVLIACTGAQGEPQAALSRMAEGSHPGLRLEAGDLVVYSSKQIPGNELAIGRVQNALAARGIDIITERQAHVHVSGHPGQPELEAMYEWIRPAIAIPVHGERRHMEEHARLALANGVKRAMVPVNGSAIRLAPDGPVLVSHEKAGRLVLDGDIILPSDGATIVERRRLSANGLIAVSMVVGRNGLPAATPAVSAHGVPVEEDKPEFLAACADAATRAAAKADPKRSEAYAEAVRMAVRRVAREWTGKKPVTDVQVIRL